MIDETTTTKEIKNRMTLPNVKELAKRFETGARIEQKPTTKRIGKFRIIENNPSQSRVTRGSGGSVVAIARRRSSLKRRTRSIGELSSSTGGGGGGHTNNCATIMNASTSSSEVRKSKSIGDVAVVENYRREVQFPLVVSSCLKDQKPLPAPRMTLQTKSLIVEPRSVQDPSYEERCRVSLTIPAEASRSSILPSPPPPIPAQPPSIERIRRIPSYLKPTPTPRQAPPLIPATLPRRPKFVSPPPPPSTVLKTSSSEGGGGGPPRVPTIPIPMTPVLNRNDDDDDDDDDFYEEIMAQSTAVSPTTSLSASVHPLMTSEGGSSEYSTYESTDFTKPIKSDPRQDEEVFDEATESEEQQEEPPAPVPKIKERFLSSTLQRNPKSNKRLSSLELEKLFRFKSELQLNLSKKVGQLRQKVGDKSSSTKRKSKCHVSVDLLNTDASTTTSTMMSTSAIIDPQRFHDDENIYGDDWSSDDDDDDTCHDDRRSSMYRQLEEHLNKAFPDYATSSQMSSEYESADVLADPSKYTARPAISELPLGGDDWISSNIQDEPSPDEEEYKRQYTCRLVPNEQPLYQHYMLEARDILEENKAKNDEDEAGKRGKIDKNQIDKEAEKAEAEAEADDDDDDDDASKIMHEPINIKPATRRESSISSDSGRGADCSTTSASALTSNTSMRRDRLVGASNFGSQRSLWCELAEVKASGLLDALDDECKLRQEAYFEVITSEASYLRSLNILITHFMASPPMLGSKSALSVLSDSDRKHLFSNIFAVRDCSERLLCDLETRLEENLVLDDLCDILLRHFDKYFEVYVKYCSNQVYQDRTLRRLKSENAGFLTAVQRLEEDKQCQGLDMRSFLMLPMQRITRYPLLLYAILDRLKPSDDRFKTATDALTSSNRIVRECNEGARRMERTEQLLEIDRRLIYKDADLKRIPLVSNSRYLVKRGILTQLVERRSSNILQSRQKARTLHVFLFSDMIMITKKKLNGTFVCKDYAARRFVDMQPIEPDNPKIPIGAIHSLVGRPHLFLCTLMRNARDKQTELLLSADSETDRERWLSAVRPPTSTNPEEVIYAEWDCPQVLVIHSYSPSQHDELQLTPGETINILKKMPDGWLFGERCNDGMGGWFPSSYVQNILNDHTRANNYRQRLRLIQAASGWHGNLSPTSIGRGGMPLMNRLRRMSSNPKSYFQSGAVGL